MKSTTNKTNTYMDRSTLIKLATREKLIEKIKSSYDHQVLAERYLDVITMSELRSLISQ